MSTTRLPSRLTVAALFVEPAGIYSKFSGVDLWPESRDARRYAGQLPVVAHPPCARWSMLAGLTASRGAPAPGDDGGCFASALESVERAGGVLEHPRMSGAWPAYGLRRPIRGWWEPTRSGWTTEVSQAAYGHKAQKLTWLYLVGTPKPLDWTLPPARARVSDARNSQMRSTLPRLSRTEAKATPPAFARLLLRLVLGECPPLRQLAMFAG